MEAKLGPLGHRVNAVVNYDRFDIVPELLEEYAAMVKALMDRHYNEVTRYTSNAFLRLKIGEALDRQKVAPHIFSSADEAKGGLSQ
ncbi:MAG: hypothetical protein JNK96_05770 [Betaproteobacteria bacterium]|nr:hypothetical protein [Betaproteobacteria bacterium]